MKTPDIIEVTFKVVNVFEKLGIPYYLGGSLASSAFGIPRATLDADIVADIKSEQVAYMEELLKREFYIDTEMINHKNSSLQRQKTLSFTSWNGIRQVEKFQTVNGMMCLEY